MLCLIWSFWFENLKGNSAYRWSHFWTEYMQSWDSLIHSSGKPVDTTTKKTVHQWLDNLSGFCCLVGIANKDDDHVYQARIAGRLHFDLVDYKLYRPVQRIIWLGMAKTNLKRYDAG